MFGGDSRAHDRGARAAAGTLCITRRRGVQRTRVGALAAARWGADGAVLRELARLSTSAALSARGFDRALRVARTIADLAEREAMTIEDVREGVRYRGGSS